MKHNWIFYLLIWMAAFLLNAQVGYGKAVHVYSDQNSPTVIFATSKLESYLKSQGLDVRVGDLSDYKKELSKR
jgi:hypothetical protein